MRLAADFHIQRVGSRRPDMKTICALARAGCFQIHGTPCDIAQTGDVTSHYDVPGPAAQRNEISIRERRSVDDDLSACRPREPID